MEDLTVEIAGPVCRFRDHTQYQSVELERLSSWRLAHTAQLDEGYPHDRGIHQSFCLDGDLGVCCLERSQKNRPRLQGSGSEEHGTAWLLPNFVSGRVEVTNARDSAVTRQKRKHEAPLHVAKSAVRLAFFECAHPRIVNRSLWAPPEAAVTIVTGILPPRIGYHCEPGHAEFYAKLRQLLFPLLVGLQQALVGRRQSHGRLRRVDAGKKRGQIVLERTRNRNTFVDGFVGSFHVGGRYWPSGDVVLVEGQRVGSPAVCEAAFREGATGRETVGDEAPKRVLR